MPGVKCAHKECGKALAAPLMQCSLCKGEAYCDKVCQVGNLLATRAYHSRSSAGVILREATAETQLPF